MQTTRQTRSSARQAALPAGAKPTAPKLGGLSLTTKVILVTFIAATFPLFIGALANYFTTLRAAERAALENLHAVALRTTEAYDQFISSNLSAIHSEAQLPVFRKLLQTAPSQRLESSTLAEAGATLAVLARKDWTSIDSYRLVDRSGTIVADSEGRTTGLGRDSQDWFQQAVATGQAFVAPVQLNSATGEAALYFSCPVTAVDGQILGVVCAKFNAAVLQQLLCNTQGLAGRRSFAILVDDSGICLAHNSSSGLIAQPLTELSSDLATLQQGLKQAGSATPYFVAHLEPVSDMVSNAAVARLNSQPWTVICAQPREVYLDPLNMQLRSGLVIGLVVVTLLLMIVQVIASRITAPVVRLSLAAQRLSAGELTARAQVEAHDELGLLAQSFNTMAAQLQQVVEDLEQRNTDLSGLNTRLRMIVESVGKLAQRPPPFQLGAILLEELGRSLDCSGGSLYLRQGDRLVLVHTLDPGHATASLPYPPAPASLFGQAVAQCQAVLINDLYHEPAARSAGWTGYRDGSLLVFPLLDARRQCLGLVSLHNKNHPPLMLQDRELGALLIAAGTETLQAAQASEQLDRSQEQYRRLVEVAQEGIVTADATETINFVNPAFAQILGYAQHEMLGHRLHDFCDPLQLEQFEQRLNDRRAGMTSSYELTLRTKTGERRVFIVAASPLYDEVGQFEGSLGVFTDITAREETEHALRASEARYRGYIDHAPDGVAVFDEQGRILEMNRAGLELIGYSTEEVLQLSLLDLAPADRREMGAVKLKRLIDRGQISVDAVWQRKNGELRHVWLNSIRLSEQRYLGYAKDITELKLTEQELAEKHAYLESIFAALTDRVVVLNRELQVADANRSFLRAARIKSDTLSQFHCWELGACPGRRGAQECSACPARQTFHDGKVHQVALQTSDQAGQTTYWETTASPVMDATGALNSVVLVVRDVTVERRLEQQVREAQKMDAIGRLAGGIAHDFNNILVAVLAYADLALAELPPDCAAAADILEVKRGAKRAADLTKQILTFSRQGDQERQPVRLKTIIGEVLRLMRASLPPTIELVEQYDTEDDLILADPTQMHQVLMNLLTNAGQAMQHGGGKITVQLSEVNIMYAAAAARHALTPGTYLLTAITDEGRGIAQENLEHVFEPFFTTKPLGQGTGLGLAVAHGIVANHRGVIEIQSAPGQGTLVQVYLPKAPRLSEPVAGVEQQNALGHERILLVDDEEVLVQVGLKMLTKLGYRVAGFTSSQEALQAFRREPAAFDVIITDQTMPHLSGTELAVAALQIRPEIPVVLCTGYTDTMPEARARELGITTYVAKPYGMPELSAAVRSALARANGMPINGAPQD